MGISRAFVFGSCIFLSTVFSISHIASDHESLLRAAILEPRHPFLRLTRSQQVSGSEKCNLPGNSDLYGLGIRLGYYTQALAAWIANFFVLSESKALRPVNTLFMFAMFVALVWISHDPSQTHAIEAFLLLQLLLTIWFVGAKEKSRWSGKNWGSGLVRMVVREGSAMGILTYNLWFWWRGLDDFQETPCGTYIFFVTKIGLYGPFRSAQKVLSIVSFCFQLFLAAGHVAQLVHHWRIRNSNCSKYFSQLTANLSLESRAGKPKSEDLNPSPMNDTSAAGKKTLYHDRACSPISDLPPKSPNEPTQNQLESPERVSNVQEKPDRFVHVQEVASGTTPNEPIAAAQSPDTLPFHEVSSTISYLPSPSSLPFPELPSFANLQSADAYLTAVLKPSTSPSQPLLSIRVPHTPLRLTLPSPLSLFPSSNPLPLLTSAPVRLSLLTPLFIHIYYLRQYPTTMYPTFLHHALTSPDHLTLAPSTLSTYLALHKSSLPRHNRKWYYLPTAAFTFLITVGLILAIELGIRWNHIGDVQSLGTVGQLVPLILGLGGLVKVLWTWVREASRETTGENEAEGREMREVEKCAEFYFGMRDRLARCADVQDV